jgi:DNA-binding transcriptional ArsR family regulator
LTTTKFTEEPVPSGRGLEQIHSSTGRIRILQHLAQVGEDNLTDIARKTNQSYTATARHLEHLVEARIVQEKNYGRVRIFRLCTETELVRKLRDLIIEWDKVAIGIAQNTQTSID